MASSAHGLAVASQGDTHPAAVVMIISTTEADAVLSRSGLTAAQLLAPFARADPGLTVQTSGEPYRLRRFCMRFEAAGDIRAASPEESERRLLALVAAHDTSQPLQEQRTAALAPWLAPVHEALSAELRYAEHAGHEYPVACLFLGSASQPQLATTFNELYGARMPSCLREGLCDPTIARRFLLLDDMADRSRDPARAQQALRELTSRSAPPRTFSEPSRNLLGTFSEPSCRRCTSSAARSARPPATCCPSTRHPARRRRRTQSGPRSPHRRARLPPER